jgi:hypothetical protein
MKKWLFVFFLISIRLAVFPQSADSLKTWEASVEVDNSLITGIYVVGVSASFDRNWLHTEIGFCEDDKNTFSMKAGYNFSGGGKLQYRVTPLIGFMIGKSYGLLPGVSLELDYGKFSFTGSSSIIVYSSAKRDESYIYGSYELDYSITDFLFAGVSVTRTKIYQTKRDLDPGLGAGLSLAGFTLSGYVYDLFLGEPFYAVALSYSF